MSEIKLPTFEYQKLSKNEKIAFWVAVIGISIGKGIVIYLSEKTRKQKYEKLRDPEFQRRLQEVLKAIKNQTPIS